MTTGSLTGDIEGYQRREDLEHAMQNNAGARREGAVKKRALASGTQTYGKMYGVALLTSTLLTIAGARFYERCELARDLLKLGIRKDHIATWVCIAYHESRFDTAARNPSSGDHGLLQISEIYWCGAGKACGLPCSALRDDDISDDVQCALTIYEEHTRLQGNGFLAWVVYPNYCKHNPKKYLTDCNFSAKDGSYSMEDRARSTNVYNSYPKVNATLSNSVQSAPLVLSYPHFLFADSVYVNGVVGMNPKIDDHRIFLDLEPNTGTVLRGAKRAQFNIFIRPITSVHGDKQSQHDINTYCLSVLLPEEFVDELKNRMLSPLNLVRILLPIVIALCCVVFIVGVAIVVRTQLCNKDLPTNTTT
ncbi:unnamed protein product, partial [Iphiclides podalirius]